MAAVESGSKWQWLRLVLKWQWLGHKVAVVGPKGGSGWARKGSKVAVVGLGWAPKWQWLGWALKWKWLGWDGP